MTARKVAEKTSASLVAASHTATAAFPAGSDSVRRAVPPPADQLLHELPVHQIELEMPSETLRQSQIEVEEARDRYIDFYDFSPVGFLTLNDKGLIEKINLTGAEMLRVPRGSLLQRRFDEFVAAADGDRWHQHFIGALQQDPRTNCELALSRADGSLLEVRIDSLRVNKAGAVPLLRVVVTDIAERKRVQKALDASREFRRQLIDSMQDGVSVVDVSGVHLDVNPALCSMTGYSRDELIGSGLPHRYWPPGQHETILSAFRNLVRGQGQVASLDLTFMRKSGETFSVIVSPSVIKDDAGRIVGYTATIKDITERKRVEEDLRTMACDLEAKVMERTRELRALSAELTMTEERERSLLAQDLHDNLAQLLAVIKIRLTSLAPGALLSSIDQIVKLVDEAEQSARTIMLQLSPPILHTLGLAPALEWLGDEIERVYGVSVNVDSDDRSTPFGIEMQGVIYRSVRELLINVAKHAGVTEASVSCLYDDSRLALAVSDAGCGFDFSGCPETWPAQHGFGLRSIYERITNLGGKMEIDSKPGSGTTVTLLIPFSSMAGELPR